MLAIQTPEMETLSYCPLCDSGRIHPADVEYNLYRCETCEYIFDNPRPTLEELIRFYSKPGKYDSWLLAEAARERLWKRRLKKLLRHAERGNLLDVGTGIGQFLALARPYFTRVSGTEVSRTALKIAKEKYNLDIASGLIDELNFPADSFDTITVFHVLEHVPDPKQTLARCGKLLKAGGVLVICVPNDVLAWTSKKRIVGKKLGLGRFQKFSSKFGLPHSWTLDEIHLSHFTPSVLRRCLEQSGFRIIEESLDPYYAATGLDLVRHTAYYACHRLLFHISRINQYDAIWMVARKVVAPGNSGEVKQSARNFERSTW
jgi:ubiquinone/menaquinone biosynthesis C-methylase UbiE